MLSEFYRRIKFKKKCAAASTYRTSAGRENDPAPTPQELKMVEIFRSVF